MRVETLVVEPQEVITRDGVTVQVDAVVYFQPVNATIEPQESSYLYYLSTPSGETIFSETLEEHNENKAKHLK
jgi:UPF0755 protein